MSFDLVERPWVLAQRLDGQVEELSLAELIRQAHDIRSIVGEVPTQEFAILRLVLALLHCATNGPTIAEWSTLWRTKELPVDAVLDYLAPHRERFDLRHPTTPFYQVAELRTSKDEVFGLERLIADVPNGPLFLTSRSGEALRRISFAEAARWVVHAQAFDVSGIKSGAVGDDRVKGGKGYPIGTGFAGSLGGVFVEGDTLRDTILLNLVPHDLPYLRWDEDDAPTWEHDPLGPAERDDCRPRGVLSLYTWQSRRIRLFGDDDGITGVLVTNGDRLSPRDLHHREPLTAWRRSATQEKLLKQPTVYLPRTHTPGRALWRGLDAMLPGTAGRSGHTEGAASLDPAVLEWIGAAINRGHLALEMFRLRAIGAVYGTQQSVIDDIVSDSVTMPVRAIVDQQTAFTVRDAAADAEQGVRAVTGLAVDLLRAAGVREEKRIDGARSEASGEAYSALDQAFRAWLTSLAGDVELAAARVAWQRQAATILREIGSRMVATAGPAAWVGREIDGRILNSGQADVWFRIRLSKALPSAKPPTETETETAAPDAEPQEVMAR